MSPLVESDLDRAIAESQTPGAVDPQDAGFPTTRRHPRSLSDAFADERVQWFEPHDREMHAVTELGHWAVVIAAVMALVGFALLLLVERA